MSSVQRSQAFLRKRKMMLVLPFLVVPFLTMAFWALGGGQGKEQAIIVKQQGLNLNLPDAKMKDENLTDKLSFYDKADKDSAKLEEWMRTDPYYKQHEDTSILPVNELEVLTQNSASKYNQRLNSSPYETSSNNPEQKLMQKLALLQKEINKQPEASANENQNATNYKQDEELSGEVDRLENMLLTMNKTNTGDQEMNQLNGTLEKILDIQHPQRIREKLKEKSLQHKQVVYAVTTQPALANVSLMDTNKIATNKLNKFYSLDPDKSVVEEGQAIEAIVHSNQMLVNGAVIQLRLATDIFINGILIPKGNPVNGTASLNNERLEVVINSIRYKNTLFPVKLELYDMDGLPGIYVPGSISRDVAKNSADNSLQLMELTTLDPSLKAQAAAAGINTVKSLMSRKVKQVKVMVKEGYKVLLKDKNNESNL
ncbi:conjugative transposon protein TraM [Hydrotalea sp. AMD]|uniref:conjugative transposon protein TraM n=2 Tax=Hydrotalea TaxID=1004300 RepID=UPI00082C4C79|nr:conjugative transposon protein TraM [Hydrotalea sp. AMD]